jgi:hypothetical protein
VLSLHWRGDIFHPPVQGRSAPGTSSPVPVWCVKMMLEKGTLSQNMPVMMDAVRNIQSHRFPMTGCPPMMMMMMMMTLNMMTAMIGH